ncbi:MAG: hypothetical protein ACP5IM_00140 [Candidatus Bathyarchaeia archaeon]
MAKEGIRLQYSGFVIFAAKIISVATGFAFQYMIARWTTLQEYGVWFNMSDIVAYFTILAGVIPFWTMRFVARGEEGAEKTGILMNFIISMAATFLYIPLIPSIASALGVQEYLYLYVLFSVQIIEIHMLNAFEACLTAKRPQVLGYGLLIEETFKVTLGLTLIVLFQRSLEGAIISLVLAVAVQCIYYLRLLAKDLRQKFSWTYTKEWLKGSAANVYNVLGNQLAAYIFIMLFAYGGETARGYYGAAAQIASTITYSSFLAFSLTPKLIMDKNVEDVTTSLKTVLMFVIPMTVGALVLPDLYLAILKPEFKDGWPILIVLAIDAFVSTTSTFFSYVLYGLERFDEKARISFRELAKSRLIIAFSLPYVHAAITLPTAFFVLTTYAQKQPMQSALYVSIINSAVHFAMFLILYALVCKMTRIIIPWKNVARYIFASVVMGCFLYAIRETLLGAVYVRVYAILGVSVAGGLLYLALLATIDEEARALAQSILREVRLKIVGQQTNA